MYTYEESGIKLVISRDATAPRGVKVLTPVALLAGVGEASGIQGIYGPFPGSDRLLNAYNPL